MNLVVKACEFVKPVTIYHLGPVTKVSRGMGLSLVECVDENNRGLLGITVEHPERSQLYYIPSSAILSVTYENQDGLDHAKDHAS